MGQVINVNGKLTPAEDAVVPVMDHGFLYGDAVYETLRTYDGSPALVERHLKRLASSCSRIRIPPLSSEEVERELHRTVREAGNRESYIRIMVTRGFGPIGYEHSLELKPGIVIIVMPLQEKPAVVYEEGVGAVLGRRRRNPVDALDPAIKSCNLLNNLLAHMEAQDAGAKETILLNTRGILSEGSHTNIFLVSGELFKTPSTACGILSGITRDVVLKIAARSGIPFGLMRSSSPALSRRSSR
jgi:branched-chain amino acid aminotransferase